MVTSCVAYNCTNQRKAGSGISFHRFPHSNPDCLAKWINAIKRKDWRPNKESYICSDRFDAACFITIPGCVGRRLKPDAIPSKFAFPKKYMLRTVTRWKSPRKCQLVVQPPLISPSKRKRLLEHDHGYSSSEMSAKAKVQKLSSKVKALRQQLHRKNKKKMKTFKVYCLHSKRNN